MTRFRAIPYNCKICGRPGTAQADLSCDPYQIDVFAKCLCCNICFDAREKTRKAEKKIYAACHFLIHISEYKNEEQVRREVREILYEATKLYAEGQCERWRIGIIWGVEFVDQLMRTPDKATEALQMYRDSLRSLQEPVI